MTREPNQPEHSDPAQDTLTGPPRWVKVSAIAAGILLLVVVAVMLLSGGQHGPARHGFGLDAPASSPAALQSSASGQV
ncbi:hypothetical protein [Arthrobacter sp. 4R501]|uniref:hypothetical protein n=1 Tax=Arthrobacter sp. 4R501 TaxID=2058886 RepID=UPI000CE48493|nr:hypothetical protein [Arthrobacter sp. 4R501]